MLHSLGRGMMVVLGLGILLVALALVPAAEGRGWSRTAARRTPHMRRMSKLITDGIETVARPDIGVDAKQRVEADLLIQSANSKVADAREARNPLQRRELYAGAIREYTTADKILPNNYEILYFLAAAIIENSRSEQEHQQSVEMMTRSVQLEPRWNENRQALGAVLDIVGRKDEAQHQREIAQLLGPSSLAQAYRFAEKGEHANALWSFGLGCPARICVQGIFPLSYHLASFVTKVNKADKALPTVLDEEDPVALVVRESLEPQLLSSLKGALRTPEGSAFFYANAKRYTGEFASWWMPIDLQELKHEPSSAMEEVVYIIARDLLPESARQQLLGVELWGHDRPRYTKKSADGNAPAHYFHYDEDGPHFRASGEWKHPMYTALVYLSDVGGLTVILNQTRTSLLARHAWVIPPRYGQVALFQSSRLHGALPEISSESAVEAAIASNEKRMTINIAFWNRPCTPDKDECQGLHGDGTSRQLFSWERVMPPLSNPSTASVLPSRKQVGIAQYDGEVWDGHPKVTHTHTADEQPSTIAESTLEFADSENEHGGVMQQQSSGPVKVSEDELLAMNAKQLKALLREARLDPKGTKVCVHTLEYDHH